MFYLLYNPLAHGGKASKYLAKVQKIYQKKKIDTEVYSVLEIKDYQKEVVDKLTKDDGLVIIGGDGTLNSLFELINFKKVPCKIYLYRAGSGNDFARGHKGRLFEITQEVKDVPYSYVNGQHRYFINGTGIGMDAAVCKAVNDCNKKEGYLKTAYKTFKKFKPYHLEIEVDGEVKVFENVFFFTVMNGKYFGGGMKIAPKAKRNDDHLDVIVIHAKSFRRILPFVPLVFLGWHLPFKKLVTYFTAKDVKLIKATYNVSQADGEVTAGVESFEVHRY